MNTQLFSQTGHLWILICVVHLNVSYYHVTYTFQSESTLYKPVWLSGWVFIYELSGCGFESCCFHFDHSFSKFLFPSLADTIENYLTMLLNFGYFWLRVFHFMVMFYNQYHYFFLTQSETTWQILEILHFWVLHCT